MKRILFTFLSLAALAGAQDTVWTKVATPQFSIYTANSVPKAEEWLKIAEAFRGIVHTLGSADDRALDPMVAVVFKNEDAYADAFPLPPDRQVLSVKISYRVAGKNSQGNGRALCAVNPEHEDLARPGFLLVAGLWSTQCFPRNLPLWLVRGLQEICVEGSVRRDLVEFGGPSKINQQRLKRKLLAPLSKFMALQLRPGDPVPVNDYDAYAEAWALAQFLIWGEGGANRGALARYVAEWERGRTHEEAFAVAFPGGMADLERRFVTFLKADNYRGESVAVPTHGVASSITTEPAPAAEVQVALGYMALLAASPSSASVHLERASELAPESAAVLDAQAYDAVVRKDETAAMDYFRRGVAAGSNWYMAHAYLALEASNPLKGEEVTVDHSDPERARMALALVRRAIDVNPAYSPGYEMFAGLMGAVPEVTETDRNLLAQGLQKYPGVALLEIGMAAVEFRLGNAEAAKARIVRLHADPSKATPAAKDFLTKIERRIRATEDLARLERLYAEGKEEPLRAALAESPQQAMSLAEAAHVRGIGETLDSFAEVRQALLQGNRAMAQMRIDELKREDLPPAFASKLAEFATQVSVAK